MVKMDLGSSEAQASSMSELANSRLEGYQSAIRALQDFAEASDLDGAAYKSAKTYGMSVIAPLIQGAILLSESTSQGVSALPSKYRAEVGDESLDSDILEAQIQAYENSLHSLRGLYRALEANETTSPWTLHRFSSQMDRLSEEKSKAMDKLRKLYAYSSSSPNVFNNMPAIAEAMEVGIGQIQGAFANFSGQFIVPSGDSHAWAKTIGVEWRKKEEIDKNYQKVLTKIKEGKSLSNKDVKAIQAYTNRYPNRELPQGVKKALDKAEMERKIALTQKQFEERLSKMNRMDLEERFGTVINSYKRWTETGLGYSVKDAAELQRYQAIIARYKEVIGDPLTPKLKHLDAGTKKKIDQLSQQELEKHYPFLKHLTGRADWDIIGNITRTPAQREERSYAIHRYFQLENNKIISRFDPQYMEKRVAFIKATGLDPLTGMEASEGDKFTAQNYGWVKAIPDVTAWADMVFGTYIGYREYHGKPIYDTVQDLFGRLKKPKVPEVPAIPKIPEPPYNRERILENIEASRRAREASDFDQYLAREKAVLEKLNFADVDKILRDGSHFDELGNLKSGVKYQTGEFEYHYRTDEVGRLMEWNAEELQLTNRERRLLHNPNTPGKLKDDHAGHLAGDRFGGSPEIDNLVSQLSEVNLSDYKKLENSWAKALKEGKDVSVNVKINYSGDGLRPSSFEVSYSIDGDFIKHIISNTR